MDSPSPRTLAKLAIDAHWVSQAAHQPSRPVSETAETVLEVKEVVEERQDKALRTCEQPLSCLLDQKTRGTRDHVVNRRSPQTSDVLGQHLLAGLSIACCAVRQPPKIMLSHWARCGQEPYRLNTSIHDTDEMFGMSEAAQFTIALLTRPRQLSA